MFLMAKRKENNAFYKPLTIDKEYINMELYDAIMREDANAIIELLNQGAALTLTNDDDSPPLHWTARNRHLEICHVLLHRGADINAKTHDGETLLYLAKHKKRNKIIRFLLNYNRNKHKN